MTGFIHSTVHEVITGPAVARLWVQVDAVAHQALVNVLSGDNNGTISTANGENVLNLGPFIDLVEQNLVNRGFSLASNMPTISPTVALFQANDLGKARPDTG